MSSFDIDKLDDVIHSRLRLGIMTLLADSEAETFNALKDALKATQGNLSIQLRKLEEAGYVSIDKQIVSRKTLTTARLTPEGRKAFDAYLEALYSMVGRKPE